MKFNLSDKPTRLFLFLGGFFIANVFIAEFIGVKIFQLETTLGFQPYNLHILGMDLSGQFTAGVLLWPVVFVMTDIINEYFGTKGVRLLSFLAAGLIAYGFIMFYFGIKVSPAEWWVSSKADKGVPDMNLAFKAIFGQGQWIIVGSLVAFLVGQILDVVVFHRIKKITGEKWLWARATVSTLVSQLIDSYVVLFIAFYVGSNWSLKQVIAIGSNNYIYKFLMAILLTPLIYLVHYAIDRYLGKETAEKLTHQAHNHD